MNSLQRIGLAAIAASVALAAPASAEVGEAGAPTDAWSWRATLYAWFPGFNATAQVPVAGGTVDFDVNPGDYLRNLQFTVMGTLEARKGPWSFVGDAIYLDFGKSNSNVTAITGPGGITLPLPAAANVGADLKGFQGALEAGYALVQTKTDQLDLVAGARYLTLQTRITWTFTGAPPGIPPGGSRERSKDFWDGVAGLRGRSDLADDWFVSYYADVGGGSSQSTWQAFAGLGYHFKWGDALVGYRHLAYDFRSGNPVSELTFSGPLVGVGFNF